MHDSPTRRHAVARLRGAQAGFLAHGMLLTVPTPQDLLGIQNGPGLNIPMTSRLVDRIRDRVAHPVIAAGFATTLFTGIRPTRVAVQPPHRRRRHCAGDLPTRRHRDPTEVGDHRVLPCPAGGPHAAAGQREFARAELANPGRRLFTPAAMSTERIAAAAVNSGRRLPDRPALDRPAPMRQE